jgi:DNA-binding SARP family transcriptional activator
MIHVRLFGAFQAESRSGSPLRLPTRKTQALLAFLAFPAGRPQARERLTALLWGERPAAQARQSFRQALAALRRALSEDTPPALLVDRDTVALAEARVDVDALAFERMAKADGADTLSRAAALYRGDFLEGFAVEEAPFDEWLVGERERLREQALEVLGRLLACHLEADAVEPAIATGLRVLAIDPLQESVHRTLMRLYARQGRRGAALRQYQACVQALRRELAEEPDAATQALYLEILRRDAAADTAVAPRLFSSPEALDGSVLAEAPLIGRDAELGYLRRTLEGAAAGEPAVVVLTGEAGVGKTRLTDEGAALAARLGARIVRGRFYETQRPLPLHGWVEALLPALSEKEHGALGGLTAASRVELARLMPGFASSETTRRVRPRDEAPLLQAVTDLVAAMSSGRFLLIILEDLHWADDMSLRLLSFLGRRTSAHRLVLLVTARNDELAEHAAATTAMDELARHGPLRRIPLLPLSERHTRDLVAALAPPMLGAPEAFRLAGEVWNFSEGNPFVVVESMRAVAGSSAAAQVKLTASVREMIGARLRRLSQGARDLAAVAAIIGRETDFPLLQSTTGLAQAAAAERLEELVRRRVMEVADERFRFVHERVRDVVHAGLIAPRRALLHAAVATALETLHADRLDDATEQLLHHWSEAGDDARTLHYLRRLADRALDRSAVAEAVRALETALGLAERLPAQVRDRACLDVSVVLAQALLYAGRPNDGRRVLLQYESALGRVDDAGVTARHYVWLGHLGAFLDEPERAIEHGERALACAQRVADRAAMGQAHYVIARASYRLAESDRGVAHAREAIELLEQTDEDAWLGHAYWALGLNLGHRGEYVEALRLMPKVRGLAIKSGDVRLETYAEWTSSWSHIALREHAAAVQTCQRAVDLAPDPLHRAAALTYLGAALMQAGAPGDAITALESALRQLDDFSGLAYLAGYARLNLATAWLEAGDAQRAIDEGHRAMELTGRARWGLMVGRSERVLGLALRALGDARQAEERMRRALEILAGVRAPVEHGVTQLYLAEIVHERGDHADAVSQLRAAHAGFLALRLDQFASRADELARSWGLAL